MLTWNKIDGLKMYHNAQLKSDDDTGLPVQGSIPSPLEENLAVGRNIGNDGPFNYCPLEIGSLTIFGGSMNQDDVDAAYIFFWSSCKFLDSSNKFQNMLIKLRITKVNFQVMRCKVLILKF